MAEVSRGDIPELGFGCMRLPLSDAPGKGPIDLEQLADMVDAFIAGGFGYFDTARGYHEGESEGALKKALIDRYPRDCFRIASKLPAFLAKNANHARAMFFISLEDTQAGYFDHFLLHNMGGSRTRIFEDYGIGDFLFEQKAHGLIEELGFSFHGSAAELESIIATFPKFDFVQLQINYADWEHARVQARACYEVAVRHGLPIIVMEPLKGGLLVAPPPGVCRLFEESGTGQTPLEWAFRFVSSLARVKMVLSGMSTIEHVYQNVGIMRSVQPLGEAETEVLEKARLQLDESVAVSCTSCGYCLAVCPQKVKIPEALTSWNVFTLYQDLDSAREDYLWAHTGKASLCLACKRCEAVCPQHIEISILLKKVAALLEVKGD